MNVRDRFLTLRLEPALRTLAKQNGTLGLAYLSRRYAVGEDELRAWLDEFNASSKTLTLERIEAVKRELGAITEGKSAAGRAANSVDVMDLAGAKAPPALPAAEPRPAKPQAPAAPAPAVAVARPLAFETPWEDTGRQFRPSAFHKWRPIFEQVAAGAEANIATLCRAAGEPVDGFYIYAKKWLGARLTDLPAEAIRAFVAWGDKRYGSRPAAATSAEVPAPVKPASPAPAAASAARDALHGDGWDQWRSDAIAALRAMGTKATVAEAQVDGAIKGLNGADCEVGELVKLALRETVPNGATSKRPADRLSTDRPPAAKTRVAAAAGPVPAAGAGAALAIGGELFRLEVIVRLVPMAAGSEVPA